MEQTVREFMTEAVVTATPQMTLKALDQLFVTHAVSGMPVLGDGELIGVVSQSDVISVLLDEQRAARRVADFHMSPFPIPIPALEKLAMEVGGIADHMVNRTVAEVMSPVAVVVGPDDDLVEVARVMRDEHIHRVMVTEGGKLVGVLSSLDLLGALIERGRDD